MKKTNSYYCLSIVFHSAIEHILYRSPKTVKYVGIVGIPRHECNKNKNNQFGVRHQVFEGCYLTF